MERYTVVEHEGLVSGPVLMVECDGRNVLNRALAISQRGFAESIAAALNAAYKAGEVEMLDRVRGSLRQWAETGSSGCDIEVARSVESITAAHAEAARVLEVMHDNWLVMGQLEGEEPRYIVWSIAPSMQRPQPNGTGSSLAAAVLDWEQRQSGERRGEGG